MRAYTRGRRMLVPLLVVTAVAVVTGSCLAAKKTVTVWHYYGGDLLKYMDEIARRFEKQNPDVQVRMLVVASDIGHSDKLLTAISVGKGPDIAMLNRFMVPSWAHRNLLTPLTDSLAKDGITRAKFVGAAWDDMTWRGQVYGLPFTMGTYGLMYNKARFRDVGLDPERPPEDLSDLDVAAAKLTTMGANNALEKLGLAPWGSQGYLYTWGWAFGGRFYDDDTATVTANDPKIVKALTWYQDYARRYTFSRISKLFSSAGGDAMAVTTGKVAMLPMNSAWSPESIMSEKDIGVTCFPYPTFGQRSTWQAGYGFVIPRSARPSLEAWRFFKYLTGAEATKEFAMRSNSNFPARREAIFAADFRANARQAKYIDLLRTCKVFSLPSMPGSDMYWDSLDEAKLLVIQGKREPKAALDRVTADVQAELKRRLKGK